MRIYFQSSLDGRSWPGCPGERAAVAGEDWLGGWGLLRVLETQLGLVDASASHAERVAALVPALRAQRGFWTPSAEVAPFAVARTLLRWRDRLVRHGWVPAAPPRGGWPGRLAQLAKLEAGVIPGMPDRLSAVDAELAALARTGEAALALAISELVLVEQERQRLPALWRQVVDKLEGAGVTIGARAVKSLRGKGDLRACFQKRFNPEGDGSLQLIRPAGPLEAAEQVAVWLAAEVEKAGGLDGTLVIGGDEVLDAALRRHGLPTTGESSGEDVDPLLELLPLVVELGRKPQDPQVALALLLMPEGPVPRKVAKPLIEALQDWPAVGSDVWLAAWDEGLAKLEGEGYRQRVAQRLEGLFAATVEAGGAGQDDGYPTQTLVARAALLETWLEGRRQAALIDGEEVGRLDAALAQCQSARALAESSGLERLAEAQLTDVLSNAAASAWVAGRFEAQAGLGVVRAVGALAGPARRVVWWSFNQQAAEQHRALPLYADELEALRKRGVLLPDPGQEAEALSRLWRRPFEQATESLLLVCPQCATDGEEQFPHPIWDEVVARLDKSQRARLERAAPLGLARLRTRALARLAPPASRAVWVLQDGVALGRSKKYSASSLGTLLGCPLAWVLKYQAWIGSGRSAALPTGTTLYGSLAHRILEVLLGRRAAGEALSPTQAAEAAGAIFDEQGPRLAAELFVAGSDDERARVRRSIVDAAQELARQLDAAGAIVEGMEVELEQDWRGVRLKGYADLVLAKPRLVVDFKWKWGSYQRQYLMNGTAHQLATYCRLVKKGRQAVGAAYFTLTEQLMQTTSAKALPAATILQGPTMEQTWQCLERAVDQRFAELDEGRVWCGTLEGEGPAQQVVAADLVTPEGVLRLQAPCRFCDFALLCEAGGEA